MNARPGEAQPEGQSPDVVRAAGPTTHRLSRVWRCAVAGAVLVAYLPFWSALADASVRNPYAGHVLLVPVIAAVLLWMDRRRLANLSFQTHAGGMALTGSALLLAGIANAAASVPLQALSFVAAIAGMALWGWGTSGLRQVRFVLVFLLLTIPPPRAAIAAVAPTLQHSVASFSSAVLNGLRIPVEQHGILLRLPDLTLEVAEACNGLRFLFVLFVFVTAFARVVLPTVSARLVLMGIAIPVAVLANAARVATLSVGAYAIGPEVVTGPAHHYIGKTFWILAVIVMIGLAWLLRSRTYGALDSSRARPGHCVAGIS